jgi:hypothetical protein
MIKTQRALKIAAKRPTIDTNFGAVFALKYLKMHNSKHFAERTLINNDFAKRTLLRNDFAKRTLLKNYFAKRTLLKNDFARSTMLKNDFAKTYTAKQ